MLDSLKKALKETPGLRPIQPPVIDPKDYITGVAGNDPMSPYNVPSSKMVYENITEVINEKGFAALFPQSYTPLPWYFQRFGITPYFNPGEDTDYAKGSLTIAGMIELSNNGQPWGLQREQDIEMVITIAEAYLSAIDAYPSDPKLRAYAVRVRRFLQLMEKGRKRMYKRQGKASPIDFVSLLKRIIRG
jgi:hypothetical protein